MTQQQTQIIVGMSGGVDSSVSALLLKQQGYAVRGVFMKNWEGDDKDDYCAAEVDLADARAVCEQIGIPIHGVNFADQYWDRVFQYFLAEYQAGRTPNPDVLCNKEIKFRAFLDYAMAQGADYIATGHYARIGKQGDEYQLLRGVDTNKDQSYFLYMLTQEQLAHSLFPVGELPKQQVREIATQHQLATCAKKDSTGICFIGERDFKAFLQRYLPAQPGTMETPEGDAVGKHDGLMYYTLGQRQGLGIGGRQGGGSEPWYVGGKDLHRNVLIVVQGHDHPLLYSRSLTAVQLHWVSGHAPDLPFTCTAKTRYRQQDAACVIRQIDASACRVEFEQPQWAVTPGQSVVFYDGEICLGGGIIQATRETAEN
ncbi:MAG: tRNA 2-thiouridine(34) synthase MnmA [Gammaproteobacteria bacterium]|nr:tRNA 2-thiouridine(34) synthase MnmA [Gammaproteobacteria bacterium]MDH5652268.1 tRNA 2-thiouridine(34) synthase MnmA [Gammaproteobacteria bacterium]